MSDLTPRESGFEFFVPAPEEGLTVEQAGSLLKVAGLETRAAVLAISEFGVGLTAGEMNQTILDKQGGSALWTPGNNYYPSICFKNPEYFERLPKTKENGQIAHSYWPKEPAYLARGVGGSLMRWGIDANLSLQGTLGEAMTLSGDTPSMLARLALLKIAHTRGVVRPEQTHPLLDPINPKTLREACLKMAEIGILEEEQDVFTLNPKHIESIGALLNIFRSMVAADPDFFRQGNAQADSIIEQPTVLRALIKRVEYNSKHTTEKRTANLELCDDAVRIITKQGREISADELAERLLPANCGTYIRYRFIASLRKDKRLQYSGPGKGEYLFYVTPLTEPIETTEAEPIPE